jgi:hypothetical protein
MLPTLVSPSLLARSSLSLFFSQSFNYYYIRHSPIRDLSLLYSLLKLNTLNFINNAFRITKRLAGNRLHRVFPDKIPACLQEGTRR